MTRPLAVLRPEPGNAQTVARIERTGSKAIALPLFAVSPIAWTPPDPTDHDAVMFTSANAARHAGAGLAALAALPVLAVGQRTAALTGGATLIGTRDAATLIERAIAAGYARILHLGGRDTTIEAGGAITRSIPVYAADPLPVAAADLAKLAGAVALLHSARAAALLAALIAFADRATFRLAALSPAILSAAGSGWGAAAAAARPDDDALIAIARALGD